jgi:DNA-binding NtrC family response regulator
MFPRMENNMTIRNEASHVPPIPMRLAHDPEVALAARTDACILLTGQPDAARELAYRLHLSSAWRHGPFTVIDCASADPRLEAHVFATLFPSDAPAEPDVMQLRLVQAGTVLLEEINRLPLAAQDRLAGRLSDLRAQMPRSRRRLIASSSEPLFDRVRNGTFDDGLYYRLNVMQLMAVGS